MEVTEKKENWLWTMVAYPFRLIASVLSALSMDDKGLSLKKILATYGTYKAGQFTESHLAENNIIILVLMWLAYAGILVGIYSISDISSAVSKIKGIKSEDEKKQDDKN